MSITVYWWGRGKRVCVVFLLYTFGICIDCVYIGVSVCVCAVHVYCIFISMKFSDVDRIATIIISSSIVPLIGSNVIQSSLSLSLSSSLPLSQ